MLAKTYKHFIKLILVLGLFFSLAPSVHAASITVSPTQVQTAVGQTVRFQVVVNTQSVAINAVDGIISYDPNTLEVTSVSRAGSVLNIWIEEPNFSNATGKISFAGGVATPGYTGSNGLVFSITAKAKKTGSATFDLNSISIRQNDGEGTEVVSSVNDSVITVAKASTVEEKPAVKEPVKETPKPQPPVIAVKLSKPELISSTHPNQDVWYNSKDVIIGWPKNPNASGVQTVFDSKPDTVATGPVQYGLNQKVLKGVRDGISYLHVRYVAKNGVSETAHYAIRVDTAIPTDINIQTTQGEANTRLLEITAKDAHSGVAFADVSLDGGPAIKILFENGKAVYSIPESYEGGKHSVIVEVYDAANNEATLTQEVELKDVPKVQIVILNKNDIKVGEYAQISGKTSKLNSDVSVTVQTPSRKVETYIAKSDDLGNIAIEILLREFGTHKIWAHIGDSDVSESQTVEVYKDWLNTVNDWVSTHNWIYGLVFILFAIAIFVLYLKACFSRKIKIDIKDQDKLEKQLQISGEMLKEEAIKQVVYLEKIAEMRPLTKEEKNMYNLCQKILN